MLNVHALNAGWSRGISNDILGTLATLGDGYIPFKRGLLHWRSHEKGWVFRFQRVKDRFVLPTFQSECSDLLQGEDEASLKCLILASSSP